MAATDDSLTADGLLKDADALFQKRDYDLALTKYSQALEQARREFNPSIESEALAQIGRMYLATDRKEEGRPWLERAANRASLSHPMGYSRYLSVKGRFEWKDGNLPQASQTFAEMYDYCVTNSLFARAVDAANMLSIVSEDVPTRIEWSRKGIQAAESGSVDNWLGPLWNNLAATFYEEKHYDSALACYETAREYHWRHSPETSKLFADYHIGMVLRHLGRYDEAETWLRPTLSWAERLENHSCVAQTLEELGEIAIARGDKTRGLTDLRRARDEFKAAGYEQSSPEIWNHINNRLEELKD